MSSFTIATLTLLIYWIAKKKDDKKKWWPWFTAAIFILIPPLIKKSRFVNLDIPLMFFTSLSLYFYWNAFLGNIRHYWGYGIFFGLALLTKGPIGFFIPIITTIHLLSTKGIKKLFDKYLFLATILGFFILGLWPLILYLTNNFDIFLNYFNFTFLHTIKKGRDAESYRFFLYFIFLLKQCSLWFLPVQFIALGNV